MIKKERLSKVLAAAGVASRRACEELIFSGKVVVNGKKILVPQTMVSLECDKISVEGTLIERKEPKLYYILNKPKGYICSNTRIGTKKLVLDIFEPLEHRLFTIGRLDRDTTGLLLLTNDGHFANLVIHPSSQISKEYLVRTEQEITHEHLIKISQGAKVEDAWVKPVRVNKVRRGTLRIVIMEGKKREIRVLMEKAGLTTVELKRIRLGGLMLGTLPLGSFRELTEKEKLQIFQ